MNFNFIPTSFDFFFYFLFLFLFPSRVSAAYLAMNFATFFIFLYNYKLLDFANHFFILCLDTNRFLRDRFCVSRAFTGRECHLKKMRNKIEINR